MNEIPQSILNSISTTFDMPVEKWRDEEIVFQLAKVVEDLLEHDFPRLINILYCLDVDEEQIKKELNLNPDSNAGLLIANLVIARQFQKIETRRNYSRKDDIPDSEKW